jgi:hypothetical protein
MCFLRKCTGDNSDSDARRRQFLCPLVDMTGKWKVMIKFSVPSHFPLHVTFDGTSSIQTYVKAFLWIEAYNTTPQFNIILTNKSWNFICQGSKNLFTSVNALGAWVSVVLKALRY